MSSVGPFQITLRRQPGYELLLTVRLEVKKRYAGVLTLSRPGWQDDPPSRSREYRDVEASELRGGRFTLVHDGSERREGYSLARVTEQLLGRISADSWTELDPITEFGFRYLQIPEQALAATPAAAAVRTTVPQGASAPASVAPLSQARPSPAASADRSSSGRGSLLARARHSASRQPMRSTSQRGNNGGASVPAEPPEPPPNVLSTTTGTSVRVTDDGEVEVRSGAKLPPKPKPVAAASLSGTPAPSRSRLPTHPPPSVMDTPVPADSSLVDIALNGMSDADVRAHLKSEMARSAGLRSRITELQAQLEASAQRERDLLALLGTWQERMTR